MTEFDFSGWATRNNLKCSDGRTILKDAFKHNDGQTVPLVWNHQHNDPLNVLGHAQLENRDEGVYAYCKFNETESGKNAKLLVEHGDVSALSIYANQLQQQGQNVLHGAIRELSLVLAGANPGAFIDAVIRHGEASDEEAIIYTGEDISLYHASDDKQADENCEGAKKEEPKKDEPKKEDEETVADVFETLNEKQKTVVYAMIGQALEEGQEPDNNKNEDSKGGDNTMKHNVFDKEDTQQQDVLSHSDMEAIFNDVKRYGSLKDAVLAHGIDNIDWLFPDAKNMNTPPEFIKRDTSWVSKIMGAVHHTPFSRIKSMFADLTEADARAKGYIKGNLKFEEVFGLLKRTTTPTTIYKKQKLDRDDVVDITDFDVVAWLKSEMRLMLDEEIARAMLVGDGRSSASDDKINEQNIRPIWTDDDLYTIKSTVSVASGATDDQKAKAFIRACVKSRKDYKGSSSPTLYTTEDVLTDCLLMEDSTGRVIYETEDKLRIALRVKEIVTVPVLENLTRTVSGTTRTLKGIIVNPADYNIGADKGGAINMFDDFDIDYNAQKYLIETRCSGALIKPYSAIALEEVTTSSPAQG
jgi:HK97 family phage prohead protease